MLVVAVYRLLGAVPGPVPSQRWAHDSMRWGLHSRSPYIKWRHCHRLAIRSSRAAFPSISFSSFSSLCHGGGGLHPTCRARGRAAGRPSGPRGQRRPARHRGGRSAARLRRHPVHHGRPDQGQPAGHQRRVPRRHRERRAAREVPGRGAAEREPVQQSGRADRAHHLRDDVRHPSARRLRLLEPGGGAQLPELPGRPRRHRGHGSAAASRAPSGTSRARSRSRTTPRRRRVLRLPRAPRCPTTRSRAASSSRY